jgi:hypothetical protein
LAEVDCKPIILILQKFSSLNYLSFLKLSKSYMLTKCEESLKRTQEV